MKRSFSLFLALRYLKPKRTFLSIITLVSITGVMLGIMVLILVISVMTGFEQELRRKVIGFDAHVILADPANGVMDGWEDAADAAAKVPGVLDVAPFVQGPVLVEFNKRRVAPKIRAIDPEAEERVTNIGQFLVAGAYDLDGDKTVLGIELARDLGVTVGDRIVLYSPGNLDAILEQIEHAKSNPESKETDLEAIRALALPLELEVTGIFESGRYLYDSEFLLVPLHLGQEIYGLGGAVHGLAIRTPDPYRAPEVQKNIRESLDRPLYVMTWMDLNKQLFDAIKMERHVMFFLLMFIILVAAFGIMNTLITITVQKTREIGIMKALGARTIQIMGVFLAQGVVVGIFGTITGLTLGITLVQYRNQVSHWLANTLGIEVFPAQVYQFNEIPAEIVPGDVALICVSAFVICTVAALIPAWFAARLDPVKALRYE